MDTRKSIIQIITEAGFWATKRDWAMGATVICGSRHVAQPGGVRTIEDYICLVPLPGGRWRLDVQGVSGEICESDAAKVAKRTVEILRLSPADRERLIKRNWRSAMRMQQTANPSPEPSAAEAASSATRATPRVGGGSVSGR